MEGKVWLDKVLFHVEMDGAQGETHLVKKEWNHVKEAGIQVAYDRDDLIVVLVFEFVRLFIHLTETKYHCII